MSDNRQNSFGKMASILDVDLVQVATPSNPVSGHNKLYFKSDNILYQKTSAGVEGAVGGSAPVQGTVTNDNAAASYVGEYVSSAVAVGSGVSLTSATPATITSISLTAGDWDVSGIFALNGTLTGTQFIGAIGNTTNSLTGTTLGDDRIATPTVSLVGSDSSITLPAVRKSLSTTTTIYLIAQANFTLGTGLGYGRISARRMR